MVKKITFLFLCGFLTICSCTKETSADYPTVQITSPYSGASYNVPGTIQITGHVSDSKPLTSVSVYIANGQNTPVEESVQIPITSDNINISCSYSLNDIHMTGGEYYVTIRASNGTNISSAFQPVYIGAAPTVRTAIYAITRNSSSVNVWKLDSVLHSSLCYSVSGDYSSSDINSYYQQLYIAGHDSGNVNAYSVPAATFDWGITATPSPAPYFTNVYCNNDDELVSYYNSNYGYVKSFNHEGAIQAVYNSLSGYFPAKTLLWNGWLLAEEKSVSLTGEENLWTYYQSSTATYQQISITGPVIAMYGYDDTHILIFGNNNSGGAYLQLYNIQTNLFSSPVSLPPAQLLSTAQMGANTYLLGFNNGSIYQYTYSTNNIIPYLNGIMASNIAFDNINNEIIVSSGNMVSEYAYNSGFSSFLTSITLPDSVRDVRILYNK